MSNKQDTDNNCFGSYTNRRKNFYDSNLEQSNFNVLRDSEDFTKLDQLENRFVIDSRDTGISMFASSSNSSSDSGSVSSGGSGSKKQGGGRKQSGSDKSGFVNCLSCGLPCSKLDTECKYKVFAKS